MSDLVIAIVFLVIVFAPCLLAMGSGSYEGGDVQVKGAPSNRTTHSAHIAPRRGRR